HASKNGVESVYQFTPDLSALAASMFGTLASLSPQTGENVPSLRPTFRWSTPTGPLGDGYATVRQRAGPDPFGLWSPVSPYDLSWTPDSNLLTGPFLFFLNFPGSTGALPVEFTKV